MTSAASKSTESSRGYTLIEVLVALTLLGFIAVFISGTFRFGARAWDISSQAAERLGQVEAVQSFLRRQLSQAAPLSFERVAAEPVPTFIGQARDVQFAAPLSIHHWDGGLYVFTLGARDGSSGDDLVVGWQAYRPDPWARGAPRREESVLLSEIADLRFGYFGRGRDEAHADWHAEWDGAAGLPDLVRIEIEFPSTDSRLWPSFVVAPRSSGDLQP